MTGGGDDREGTPQPPQRFTAMERAHRKYVFERRTRILAEMLSRLIPDNASVLDIGCGNGRISSLLLQQNTTLSIQGLEVLERPECRINYGLFDGKTIPYEESSFDMCMFIDVLHHTEHIEELLREASRVSRRHVLIKDHLYGNTMDKVILKFMDWVGNRPHGVELTYNYLRAAQWDRLFRKLGLKQVFWNQSIPLYVFPANILFGRNLHFVSLLEP
jgi:ubiquinone/menaquinone biosynthesis C-methylase UbiE